MKPEDWSSSETTHHHFEMHAKIYTNVFFFLAVICFVSIMDRWVNCCFSLHVRDRETDWSSCICRVDICQFSLSTLFNPTEERSLTISFRAVVLIMIYAGTILLNLLAAFVDDKFPVIGALQQTNMTAEILDGAVKVNVENVNEVANVSETKIRTTLARALWRNVISSREIITHYNKHFLVVKFSRVTTKWYIYGTRYPLRGALALYSDGLSSHSSTRTFSTIHSSIWTSITRHPRKLALESGRKEAATEGNVNIV